MHNEIVIHKCPNCFSEFYDYIDLLEHFNTHFGANRIKCDLCPKWFLFGYQLQSHVDEEHENIHPIVCPDCGKISKSKQNFISHFQAVHTKEDGTINCQTCNRKFTKIVSFYAHLRHEHQKFRCKLCGKNFRCASLLKTHSLSHASTKTVYPCKLCDVRFHSLHRLQKHAEVHVKRPYSCDLCANSFTHFNYLNRHKWRMHSILNKTHEKL